MNELDKERNKLKQQDFSCSYGIMVRVSKSVLEEVGVLEAYIKLRGRNVFTDEEYGDSYDYITILQAKLIGLIK